MLDDLVAYAIDAWGRETATSVTWTPQVIDARAQCGFGPRRRDAARPYYGRSSPVAIEIGNTSAQALATCPAWTDGDLGDGSVNGSVTFAAMDLLSLCIALGWSTRVGDEVELEVGAVMMCPDGGSTTLASESVRLPVDDQLPELRLDRVVRARSLVDVQPSDNTGVANVEMLWPDGARDLVETPPYRFSMRAAQVQIRVVGFLALVIPAGADFVLTINR